MFRRHSWQLAKRSRPRNQARYSAPDVYRARHSRWEQTHQEPRHDEQSEVNPGMSRLGYKVIGASLAITAALLAYEVYEKRSFANLSRALPFDGKSQDDDPLPLEIEIRIEEMIGTEIDDIDDNAIYEVGFGTKEGFIDWKKDTALEDVKLTHASLVFQDIHADGKKNKLVIGRQSPHQRRNKVKMTTDENAQNKSADSDGNDSIGDTIIFGEGEGGCIYDSSLYIPLAWSVSSIIATQVQNEKHYELFPDSPIRATMLKGILINGRELKELKARINAEICRSQRCTMLTSNCYSAATFGLLELMRIVANRADADPATTNKQLRQLDQLFWKHANDNHGIGVFNNPVVREKRKDVSALLAVRGIYSEQKPHANKRLAANHPIFTTTTTSKTKQKTSPPLAPKSPKPRRRTNDLD